MAKTNVSELSAGKITIEAQADGTPAQASSLGAATVGTLALGTGNAVSAAAAKASTHQVAISINGTTYFFLVSNV